MSRIAEITRSTKAVNNATAMSRKFAPPWTDIPAPKPAQKAVCGEIVYPTIIAATMRKTAWNSAMARTAWVLTNPAPCAFCLICLIAATVLSIRPANNAMTGTIRAMTAAVPLARMKMMSVSRALLPF